MKTYIKTSVPRPAGSPGKGITPKDVLTLIDVEDIVSFPPRDGAGVVLVGDIVVKPMRKVLRLRLKGSIQGIKEKCANLRRTG